jgi:hypothetical protein
MSEFDYKGNFVKFLKISLDTWGNENTLEIVMTKKDIEGLLNSLMEGVCEK